MGRHLPLLGYPADELIHPLGRQPRGQVEHRLGPHIAHAALEVGRRGLPLLEVL